MAMHGASTNKQNGPNEMLIIIIKIYMKIIIHSYIYENKAAGNNFQLDKYYLENVVKMELKT